MGITREIRSTGTPAYFMGRAAAVWRAALLRSFRGTRPIGRVPTTRSSEAGSEKALPA